MGRWLLAKTATASWATLMTSTSLSWVSSATWEKMPLLVPTTKSVAKTPRVTTTAIAIKPYSFTISFIGTS